MSIAKVSEITAASSESFEDAVRNGIKRFAKTVEIENPLDEHAARQENGDKAAREAGDQRDVQHSRHHQQHHGRLSGYGSATPTAPFC